MKEELISFETAKLAKDKGFVGIKSQANHWYYSDGVLAHEANVNGYKGLKGWNTWDATHGIRWDAPTQSLLQRWLREEHGIVVIPDFNINTERYFYWIMQRDVETKFRGDSINRFEHALEAGLKEALNLIK